MSDQYQKPGHLILDLMKSRGWTQRVLSVVLGTNEAKIYKIIAGKRPVKADLAIALGELFQIEPDAFLDLQKKYDLNLARIETRPDPGRATRAQLFGELPISDMIKRGWIQANGIRDTERVQSELVRFFGVGSVDEIEFLPHAAKKTDVSGPVNPAQLAWLYRARKIASEMLAAKYSKRAVNAAIDRLHPMTASEEAIRDVPRVLAESGIRFVVVETIPKAKIDGVCFWLNDSSPVVGMSLRYDRIDNFWFVLRHELEHVRLLHGKSAVMLDAELEGERAGTGDGIPSEERVANAAAAEFCVPQAQMKKFVKAKAPFYRERDLIGFSRALKLHPGLIAGQLQHVTGRYDRFRQHQVKVRNIVRSATMADGWGDVVPVGP